MVTGWHEYPTALLKEVILNNSIFYYDLLNTPSACGGVSTRKRGLGGNDVSPQV